MATDAEVNRIVVACGDGRLDEYLDSKYNDGKTSFIRNPGGNATLAMPGVRQVVASNPATKSWAIFVVPHTSDGTANGCGAMGLVAEGQGLDTHIEDNFVSLYRNESGKPLFTDRHNLEHQVNPQMQEQALTEFFQSMGINASVHLDLVVITGKGGHESIIGHGEVPEHTGAKLLVVTDPSTAKFSALLSTANEELDKVPASEGGGRRAISDMYLLQTAVTGAHPDPLADLQAEIFVRFVGTKTVRAIAETTEQSPGLKAFAQRLSAQPFMEHPAHEIRHKVKA